MSGDRARRPTRHMTVSIRLATNAFPPWPIALMRIIAVRNHHHVDSLVGGYAAQLYGSGSADLRHQCRPFDSGAVSREWLARSMTLCCDR